MKSAYSLKYTTKQCGKFLNNMRKQFTSSVRAEWVEASAAVIAVLLAVYFFGIERAERKKEAKIEFTINFINTFQTEELTTARSALFETIIGNSEAIKIVSEIGQAPDQAFLVPMREATFEKPGSYSHLLTIIDRYSAAIQCVEAEICDQKVMDRYLYDQACNFYKFYKNEISHLAIMFGVPALKTRIPNYLIMDRDITDISNSYQCQLD